jgi:2-succinyl-6-hydroxy-2,4-cyclohexadiene-1-carboxylate synthase
VAELERLAVADGIVARVQPGPGSKVLWIHGYTLDSGSWREMWRRLPGWHHLGLDLPAHGDSSPIRPEDDLRQLGRKVVAFCREQEIRHVVALSFGTLTATQAAIEAPDFFHSMVLGAPTLAGGPSDPEVGATYFRLQQLYTTVGPGPEMKKTWMSCIAWNGIDALPALREELGQMVADHGWTELDNWAILRLLNPAQDVEDLRRITTPVLIVIGDQDLPAFHTCAGILESNVPRCRRVTLQDTHHLCMLESPAPSAAAIEAHLRAHDRSSIAASPEPAP